MQNQIVVNANTVIYFFRNADRLFSNINKLKSEVVCMTLNRKHLGVHSHDDFKLLLRLALELHV